ATRRSPVPWPRRSAPSARASPARARGSPPSWRTPMPDLLERFAPPRTTPTPEAERAARAALLKHAGRRRRRRLPLVPAFAALAALALVVAWPRGNDVERPAAPRQQTGPIAPTRPLTKGE